MDEQEKIIENDEIINENDIEVPNPIVPKPKQKRLWKDPQKQKEHIENMRMKAYEVRRIIREAKTTTLKEERAIRNLEKKVKSIPEEKLLEELQKKGYIVSKVKPETTEPETNQEVVEKPKKYKKVPLEEKEEPEIVEKPKKTPKKKVVKEEEPQQVQPTTPQQNRTFLKQVINRPTTFIDPRSFF